VCRIQGGEDFVARIRLGRKLDKEGRKEALAVLFIDVSKVKIEIGDRSQSGGAPFVEGLDDGRAGRQV
jgi:hypothetical protein